MKPLAISSELTLPEDAPSKKFAFIGASGSGKTYGAIKLAELFIGSGVQIVAIDPVGVWWGLRLSPSGKGTAFSIPVIGGMEADLPLEPAAGALVADLIVDRGISAVLDVSLFRKNQRKQFLTDFAEQLFHRKKENRSPLHLFLEEAQTYIPQKAMKGEERMLGAFEDLTKIGRNYGIGNTLITQRPQAVNKEALNQAVCLFVLQTIGTHERKAIEDWIHDKGVDEDIAQILPKLDVGHARVWSPAWLRISQTVKIAKRLTYDVDPAKHSQSATATKPRPLSKDDLAELRESIKETIEKAEADDPKKLRAKIAELQRTVQQLQLAKPAAPPKPAKKEIVYQPAILKKDLATIERCSTTLTELLNKIGSTNWTAVVESMQRKTVDVPPPAAAVSVRPAIVSRTAPVVSPRPAAAQPAGDGAAVPTGAQKILAAAVMRHPTKLTRSQLATLAGSSNKSSTYKEYLRQLIKAGYLLKEGDYFQASTSGIDYIGEGIDLAPESPEEVQRLWLERLPRGPSSMLRAALAAHPQRLSKEELGQASGFSSTSSTFKEYLRICRANGVLDVDGDNLVGVHDNLFVT